MRAAAYMWRLRHERALRMVLAPGRGRGRGANTDDCLRHAFRQSRCSHACVPADVRCGHFTNSPRCPPPTHTVQYANGSLGAQCAAEIAAHGSMR
eukprot:gene56607-biopygen60373